MSDHAERLRSTLPCFPAAAVAHTMPRDKYQYDRPEVVAMYDRLLAEQGGKCAVRGCERTPKTRRFHIDHDHKTGAVRGLLCHWHNRIMPRDADEARAMGEYLDRSGLPAIVEHEVLPTMAQIHREAAKVTPRLPK